MNLTDRKNTPTAAPLSLHDFSAFYKSVHQFPPFEWQKRLAEQVCHGSWPDYVKLPTSSGKTSVIDIAIFALAFQACEQNRPHGTLTAARRMFFVVDRRIIVNEAYLQTRATAQKLWDAVSPNASEDTPKILRQVAIWLRSLAADPKAPPLDCRELRGGIYRDDAWVRSPLQPTVLACTVDQIGSRLLFRGYGVSDRNLPIHAALTATDSLIILDEAHCSKPFSQTLDAVANYRKDRWAEQLIKSPFSHVQMTATPPADLAGRKLFELDDQLDYEKDELLYRRHCCSKPVTLVEAKGAKGKSLHEKLAKNLVEHARELAAVHGCKRIAIIVNRVVIAKAAYKLLQTKHADDSSLMIGRMRPIDREALTNELQTKFRSGADVSFENPQFVVATQCLEVGADFDFDGMVCQCASLDALRQRFGRMNRLGDSDHARGIIVAAEGDLQAEDKLKDDKPLDPIYGNALARTWNWLHRIASPCGNNVEGSVDSDSGEKQESECRLMEIDFGIRSMDELLASRDNHDVLQLAAPAPDSPVLMPAHMDMLCQTSPRPKLEPDVAAYLHGPDRGMPEVRVCWRADLDVSSFDPTRGPTWNVHSQNWIDAVSLCPPTSSECLVVPLHIFRKWLSGELIIDQTSDVLGEKVEKESVSKQAAHRVVGRRALIWRGTKQRTAAKRSEQAANGKDVSEEERSILVGDGDSRRIRPNDTIVIPAIFGGWNELGFIPGDLAEPDFKAMEDSTAQENSDAPQDDSNALFAAIDVADQAFCQSRARTILRVHRKLRANAGKLRTFFDELLNALDDREADLDTRRWKSRLKELESKSKSSSDEDENTSEATTMTWERSRIAQLLDLPGQLVRYPGGVVWTTGLHSEEDRSAGMPPLPLNSYGDDDDSLTQTGRVKLMQHLADVHDEACRLTSGTDLSDEWCKVVASAAMYHDIGKADPRFQAMLLSKPVSVAFMQSTLWAKSELRGGHPSNELSQRFRHEMLSLDLLERFESAPTASRGLLEHLIVSHHGYARPLAPICVDQSKPGFRLDEFGCEAVSHEERKDWIPAHRLDSGIADRFWILNRQFGWWGLAWLETMLRLADWSASANPGHGNVASLNFSLAETPPKPAETPPKPATQAEPLVLDGIDGSKPLGFLAAMGVFRVLDNLPDNSGYAFSWIQTQGAWRPMIHGNGHSSLTDEWLLDLLTEHLERRSDHFPPLRLAKLVGHRREIFQRIAEVSSVMHRDDADWLSCNGSDVMASQAISQLQTSRKDNHPKSIHRLVSETTRSHLQRSLFEPWDYSDPIAGISLHIDPREDRRHAYQWNRPSGDPIAKIYGGMIGANRLALEAWPLFQSLPAADDKLATVGFDGLKANNTRFTWPIWTTPIPICVIATVLSLRSLQRSDLSHDEIEPFGIAHVYRCSRILVGKTPNLTTASPVLT